MFAELSKQIDNVRQEMTQEFASVRQEMAQEFASVRQEMAQELTSVRKEMAQGFAIQKETGHEILKAVEGPFKELQDEVDKTKTSHGKRLQKIERQIGLA